MSYPKATWRLIKTPPASGPWNMAVDEALLEEMKREGSVPVLRLFGWEPACLSLGYAQSVSDVDRTVLAANGWELVRRPTGGRAILHTDELTYAVIAPQGEPRLAGGVVESYRRLAEALLLTLHKLDIPAHSDAHAGEISPDEPGPVCFDIPSHYEITVNGQKLIGSAQARRREGILQHGTLPLHGDLTRITQALNFPDQASRAAAAQRLLERAATVESSLGRTISWEEAATSFEDAFKEALNLTLTPEELTPQEKTRTTQLLQEKFANPTWTDRL